MQRLKIKLWAIAIAFISVLNAEEPSCQQVFSKIYKNCEWKFGEGFSGAGSLPEQTVDYRKFLQQFIRDHHVKSVIDFGCGDWSFSKEMDWSGINYIGCDVVPGIIERNRELYFAPNIHFYVVDAIEDLPPADLFLCKDVMQHLSNKDIEHLLSHLDKYRFALITNDVVGIGLNEDIPRGAHRPLDLNKPPFCINGEVVLNYKACNDTKQVVLIRQ